MEKDKELQELMEVAELDVLQLLRSLKSKGVDYKAFLKALDESEPGLIDTILSTIQLKP